MLNDKLKAARGIATSLGTSETSVDQSLIAGANLLISICDGRLRTGVAAENASDAVSKAVQGLTALNDARDNFVACHQALAILRDAQGLRGDMVGCTPDKPKGEIQPRTLSAVA
ncbi:MAG: hypothetical protein KF730_16195 [Sphingomonas sp.]|uniref:hypothetical protein n=1 Tax=Sphingomonas sp. TaxID=28214 RepID=UPI0025E77AC0|nr:hypothetical protein [Sphingomonas sp.]MBX3566102.1 hypothetical protein [Sphingomonas sp.]